MSSSLSGIRKKSVSHLWKDNKNLFVVTIICPDYHTVSKIYSIRDTVDYVIEDICTDLEIDNQELFAIATYNHNEYRFISRKKSLRNIFFKESVVTKCQAIQLTGIDENQHLNIKSSRIYLRVKYFPTSINNLSGNTLYYYYEQIKLDILKYQNLMTLQGYNKLLHTMAAKSIWLKHGVNAIKEIKNKTALKKLYLPQYEINSSTEETLNTEIKKIFLDFSNVKTNDPLHDFSGNNIVKNGNMNNGNSNCKIILEGNINRTKESGKIPEENEVPDIAINDIYNTEMNKAIVMKSFIKEASKLPFYGVHFYQLIFIKDDEFRTNLNCKIGIGPLGILSCISPDYTTWEKLFNLSWKSIIDVSFSKNIFFIQYSMEETIRVYQFQCLDEKEAKYLYKQIKELKQYQKNEADGKRNSIGATSSIGISPLVSTGNMMRSVSLTLLRSPRVQHFSDIYTTNKSKANTSHFLKRASWSHLLSRGKENNKQTNQISFNNNFVDDQQNVNEKHMNMFNILQNVNNNLQNKKKIDNEIIVIDLEDY